MKLHIFIFHLKLWRPNIETDNSIFVVSDLHIGDGCRHDKFSRSNKADLFLRFLDYVQKQNGEIIIAGDFLELWHCRIEGIIENHRSIFEQLNNMNCLYVVGNHDQRLDRSINNSDLPFGVLNHGQNYVYRKLGNRLFKFMHGHEVDPFIGKSSEKFCKAFGLIINNIDFTGQVLSSTRDFSSEALLEIGEFIISGINLVKRLITRAADECYSILPDGQAVMLKGSLRTKSMLKRYHQDISSELHDVAVAGHTHQPGCLGDWYYNSGSWTGDKSNFLRIDQSGNVDILNWTQSGPEYL